MPEYPEEYKWIETASLEDLNNKAAELRKQTAPSYAASAKDKRKGAEELNYIMQRIESIEVFRRKAEEFGEEQGLTGEDKGSWLDWIKDIPGIGIIAQIAEIPKLPEMFKEFQEMMYGPEVSPTAGQVTYGPRMRAEQGLALTPPEGYDPAKHAQWIDEYLRGGATWEDIKAQQGWNPEAIAFWETRFEAEPEEEAIIEAPASIEELMSLPTAQRQAYIATLSPADQLQVSLAIGQWQAGGDEGVTVPSELQRDVYDRIIAPTTKGWTDDIKKTYKAMVAYDLQDKWFAHQEMNPQIEKGTPEEYNRLFEEFVAQYQPPADFGEQAWTATMESQPDYVAASTEINAWVTRVNRDIQQAGGDPTMSAMEIYQEAQRVLEERGIRPTTSQILNEAAGISAEMLAGWVTKRGGVLPPGAGKGLTFEQRQTMIAQPGAAATWAAEQVPKGYSRDAQGNIVMDYLPQGTASRAYQSWLQEQFADDEDVSRLMQYFPEFYKGYTSQPSSAPFGTETQRAGETAGTQIRQQRDIGEYLKGLGRPFFERLIPTLPTTAIAKKQPARTQRVRYV